jgi:hypothetical protein
LFCITRLAVLRLGRVKAPKSTSHVVLVAMGVSVGVEVGVLVTVGEEVGVAVGVGVLVDVGV